MLIHLTNIIILRVSEVAAALRMLAGRSQAVEHHGFMVGCMCLPAKCPANCPDFVAQLPHDSATQLPALFPM